MIASASNELRVFIVTEQKLLNQLERFQLLIDQLFISPWMSLHDYKVLFGPFEEILTFQRKYVQSLTTGSAVDSIAGEFISVWFNYLTHLPSSVETAQTYKRNQMLERMLRPFTDSRPAWLHLISMLDCPRQHFSKYPKRLATLLPEYSLNEFISDLLELDQKIQQAQQIIHHQTVTQQIVSKISLDYPTVSQFGICHYKNRFKISTNKAKIDKSSTRICFLFDNVILIIKENIINTWSLVRKIEICNIKFFHVLPLLDQGKLKVN